MRHKVLTATIWNEGFGGSTNEKKGVTTGGDWSAGRTRPRGGGRKWVETRDRIGRGPFLRNKRKEDSPINRRGNTTEIGTISGSHRWRNLASPKKKLQFSPQQGLRSTSSGKEVFQGTKLKSRESSETPIEKTGSPPY